MGNGKPQALNINNQYIYNMKKKLGELKKEGIYLKLEMSRIEREKSKIVLDKSLLLYFCFLIVGVIGFTFNYLDSLLLNTLIISGIVVLVVGSLPYILTVTKEEREIKRLLREIGED